MGGWLRSMFRPRICVAVSCALIALFSSQAALSERAARPNTSGTPVPNKPDLGTAGERLNANTIAIIAGNLNATYLTIAYDLSAVLDNGDEFRVLPVVGKGGGQNIKDVRYLKGIDLGITQSNLLNAYRRSGEIGTIDDKIVYIAKLFNEEMHLVVRAESGVTSIDQLAGKKVNFSDIGSGSQLSSRDIFDKLGIKVEEVNMGQADAIEALKKGEIAATILIAGKPAASMAKIAASEGFRVLPVPYRKPLQADYLPTTLSADDYPKLVDRAQQVETIAVGAVLIAYNWPEGSGSLSPHPAVRRQFLPEARRISEGAASSEVEGDQSFGDAARLDPVQGRRRMAEAAAPGAARGFRSLRCRQTARCFPSGARTAVQGFHAMAQRAGQQQLS